MPTTTTTITVTWADDTTSVYTTTGTITASANGDWIGFTGKLSGDADDAEWHVHVGIAKSWKKTQTTN